MHRYRSYVLGAAGLAAALAGFEIVRLVALHGGATATTTLLSAILGGVWLVGLNLAAAITMGFRRPSGFLWGTFAAIGSIAEGIVLRASGSWAGVLYMVAGLVVLGCTMKSLAYFRALVPPSRTVPSMMPARA